MTRAEQIVERLRTKHGEQTVGVISSFGKDLQVKGRTIEVIANTDDMDLDNEVVVPKGADTSYFLQNRSVFVDHKYDLEFHVGTLRGLDRHPSTKDQTAWKARVGVLGKPGMPDDILTTAREVGIGVSIGFAPLNVREPTEAEAEKHGGDLTSVVDSWKWLELSFTAMPCNVACQSMAMVEDDSKMGALEDLVVKGRISRASGYAFGLDESARVYPSVEIPKQRKKAWMVGGCLVTRDAV